MGMKLLAEEMKDSSQGLKKEQRGFEIDPHSIALQSWLNSFTAFYN